jgi:hypothetical protein
MVTEAEKNLPNPPSVARLWVGVLAGPIAWALHLNASYAAVPYLCGSRMGFLLHVFTLLALCLAGAGFFSSLRSWRTGGKPSHTRGGGIEGRTSLLSIGGMATGAFFFFVILVQSTPNYFVESTPKFFAGPCQ